MIKKFHKYLVEMKSHSSSISPEEFDNLYDVLTNFDLSFYTKDLHEKGLNLADLNSKMGKQRFSKKERAVANYILYKLSKIFDTSTTGLGNMIIHSEDVAIHDDILCSENDIFFQIRIPEKTVIKFSDKEKQTFGGDIEENLSIPVYFKLDFNDKLYDKYNEMFRKDFNVKEGEERVFKLSDEKIIFEIVEWKVDHILVKETDIDEKDSDTFVADTDKDKYYSVIPKAIQIKKELDHWEKQAKRIK